MPGTPRPKRVNYDAIDPEDGVYAMLMRVVARTHPELNEARFFLCWRKCLKPDPDGRLVLGKVGKCSDVDREAAPHDIRLALNQEAWAEFDSDQREAVLDHYLCRIRVARNKDRSEKRDEKGRLVYRGRKPDVVEFSEIIDRHGFYLADLKDFAEKVLAKRKAPLFADVPETTSSNGEATSDRQARPKRPSRRKTVA